MALEPQLPGSKVHCLLQDSFHGVMEQLRLSVGNMNSAAGRIAWLEPLLFGSKRVGGEEAKTQRPQQVTSRARFKFKSPSSLARCCLHHCVNVLA